jgi:TPR repeat protein
MKKMIIITIIALVAAGAAAAQTLDELRKAAEAGDPKAQCELGNKYYEGTDVAQDYGQAFKWHLKAASQGHGEASWNVAASYAYGDGVAEDLDKAEEWLEKSLKQGFKDVPFLDFAYIADKRRIKGEYDKAIALYTRALSFNSGYAPAYYNRGTCYLAAKNHAKAIADYTQAIALYPKYAEAYNARGWAYYERGDYAKAIADAGKAVELNPKFYAAYDTRACAYLARGNIAAALRDYQTITAAIAAAEGFSADTVKRDLAAIHDSRDSRLCAGAAAYMAMQASKFLGKSDASRYETMLKYIQDRDGVTRKEIMDYMTQGISAAVDEQFNQISWLLGNAYNAVLTKTADNKYRLSYEGDFNRDGTLSTRTVKVSSLEALPSADFTPADIAAVRAQAANMPAAKLDVDSLSDVKIILTSFYTNPNNITYTMMMEVYKLYNSMDIKTRLQTGDETFMKISASYANTLSALNEVLAKKIFADARSSAPLTELTPAQQRRLTTLR